MDPITLVVILLGVTIGGLLVGVGVHFVPVGGAPAAMAQATGIGTGTTMLAFSSGALGLISAGFTMHDLTDGSLKSAYPTFGPAVINGTLLSPAGIGANLVPILLVIVAGIVGAMLMMVILAVVANILYAFAIAVPLVSAKVKFDPITGDRQDLYVTRGTEGHGTPTVAVISSLLGGLFGGAGGAFLYLSFIAGGFGDPKLGAAGIAVAAFLTIGIFFVNSVLASYNITGTIEGFHDPKFKRVPRAIIACTVASFVMGLWAIALIYFGVGVV
jgi:tetrahydromethanopterin S-methyltransferase subunit D